MNKLIIINILEFFSPEYLNIFISLLLNNLIKNNCVAISNMNGKISKIIDGELIKAIPEEDVDRTSAEGKASSVQFIHFKFNDNQIEKFKSDSSKIEIGIDHKEYSHTTRLNLLTVKSLSADFN